MSQEFTTWALGLGASLILMQLGWISWLTRRLAAHEVKVAEEYVHKDAMAFFDTKTSQALQKLESQVDEILKTLYELKGRSGQ